VSVSYFVLDTQDDLDKALQSEAPSGENVE
jgi:hypothetical protein